MNTSRMNERQKNGPTPTRAMARQRRRDAVRMPGGPAPRFRPIRLREKGVGRFSKMIGRKNEEGKKVAAIVPDHRSAFSPKPGEPVGRKGKRGG